MREYLNDPEQKPSFMSEAPFYVKFFIDPSRPLPLRLGVAVVIVSIFFYPLLALKQPRGKTPPPTEEAAKLPVAEVTPQKKQRPPEEAAAPAEETRQVRARSDETDGEAESGTDAQSAEPVSEQSAIFSPVPNLFPFVNSIFQLKSGDVWISTMQEMAEVKGANPAAVQKKLDPASYDRLFNTDFSPITAASGDDNNELWIGSRDGGVMHYISYDWKIIFENKEPIKDRIYALHRYKENLYIGGKGLWKWNIGSGKLTRYKGFVDVQVRKFVIDKELGLLAAASNGVWKLTDAGWEQLLGMNSVDGGANTIYSDHGRGILVGTADGLERISTAGVLTEHSLSGHPVVSISGSPQGQLWVATKDNGIRYFDGKFWYQGLAANGLPGDAIKEIFRDQNGQVWIAIGSKGVFVADEKAATDWIKLHKDVAIETDSNTPKVYKNACEAGATELNKARASGSVARETIDAVPMVFFQGKLACPAGKGFRREDGTVALLRDWNITIFSESGRQEVQVPKELPADQANMIFLDSRNRIWIGMPAGVAFYQAGTWVNYLSDPLLANNVPQSFAEDARANVWLGTSPVYDPQSKTYAPQPPLHKFDGQLWTHFGQQQGLNSWLVNSLLLVKDGEIALGTQSGICFIGEKGLFSLHGIPKHTKQSPALSLSQDSQGIIWVGHSYIFPGVTWYDEKGVHNLDSKSGLFTDRIASVFPDGKDRIWLVGANGNVGVYPRKFFTEAHLKTPEEQTPEAVEEEDKAEDSKATLFKE